MTIDHHLIKKRCNIPVKEKVEFQSYQIIYSPQTFLTLAHFDHGDMINHAID